MKLSTPIYFLKRRAKDLKRSEAITMTQALDRVARAEGFNSWSLLQSKMADFTPRIKEDILDYLNPGDLTLIAARPGLGKTVTTLEVLLQAARSGRPCFFFSLEYTHRQAVEKIGQLDSTIDPTDSPLNLDCSDDISSDYIIAKTKDSILEGAIIAVDYLQLLDQQRDKPPVQKQVEDLKEYAREKKCILIFISQIDRTYDQTAQTRPGLDDIRLPNPLDLGLFNKSIFVQNGEIHI